MKPSNSTNPARRQAVHRAQKCAKPRLNRLLVHLIYRVNILQSIRYKQNSTISSISRQILPLFAQAQGAYS
jgi:hypothetical protein